VRNKTKNWTDTTFSLLPPCPFPRLSFTPPSQLLHLLLPWAGQEAGELSGHNGSSVLPLPPRACPLPQHCVLPTAAVLQGRLPWRGLSPGRREILAPAPAAPPPAPPPLTLLFTLLVGTFFPSVLSAVRCFALSYARFPRGAASIAEGLFCVGPRAAAPHSKQPRGGRSLRACSQETPWPGSHGNVTTGMSLRFLFSWCQMLLPRQASPRTDLQCCPVWCALVLDGRWPGVHLPGEPLGTFLSCPASGRRSTPVISC